MFTSMIRKAIAPHVKEARAVAADVIIEARETSADAIDRLQLGVELLKTVLAVSLLILAVVIARG